jgi:hypothetical protein
MIRGISLSADELALGANDSPTDLADYNKTGNTKVALLDFRLTGPRRHSRPYASDYRRSKFDLL